MHVSAASQPEAEPPLSPAEPLNRRRLFGIALFLLLIVLVGGWFRTLNLRDWDGGTDQHPDERFMTYTVVNLSVPARPGDYFASICASPVPSPRNPGSAPEELEPGEASGCSTLNPRNFNWSRGYVYGTLPTTLTRVIAERTGRTGADEIQMIGRGLSAGLDIVTLLALFALGLTLYNPRTGLLAAALYAVAVMPIQQSHYFTVDNFAVCFGTLALLFITRLGRYGRWSDAVWSGVWIAAATASKINMAALVGLVFVAVGMRALRNDERGAMNDQPTGNKRSWLIVHRRSLLRAAGLLLLSGIVCFAGFRVFQPDAFVGPQWWNLVCFTCSGGLLPDAAGDAQDAILRLDPRFVQGLRQAQQTASGAIDIPPSIQWANRTPWLFAWQNMLLWGMGVPLGIAAWLGWAAAGWLMFSRRRWDALIPWVWVAFYFAWQGGQFVPSIRYFLPIYPPLLLFAAWGMLELWRRRRTAVQTMATPFGLSPLRLLDRLRRPSLIAGGIVFVVLATLAWAWAYSRIYTRPYTRVAAAEWLERAEPDGAVTTWEIWDDPLPLPQDRFNQLTTGPYAEEELRKYIGDGADYEGLLEQLAQADYVVLTSPRIYGSVERMPQRYPATLRYYQALFDGSLGFELAAELSSRPTLFGIPIDDSGADEAFWVYDHPPVLIFRRSDAFSFDRARQVITGDIMWDEIYRGLRPLQLNEAPRALQLTDRGWELVSGVDTRYLFSGNWGAGWSALLWLLSVELAGLAGFALLWRLRLPLADRGFAVGRIVGLLLLALPPALLAATELLPANRLVVGGWAVVLYLLALLVWWRERWALRAFIGARWRELLVGYALYGVIFAAAWALGGRIGNVSAQLSARWLSLVRSPVLPPPDPFFAGGHDTFAYAASLPFATLERLLGALPGEALRLALATAAALAALGVWSAARSLVFRARFTASWWPPLVALAAPLLLFGALVFRDSFGLWQAVATGNLEVLGAVALAASCLAAAGALRNGHSRQLGVIGVLVLVLAFVRGSGIVPLLAVWLACAAIGWWGLRDTRVWAARLLPALLGALLLGNVFGWSVEPPAATAVPIEAKDWYWGLSPWLPAVLLVYAGQSSGLRQPFRWLVTLALVGGYVALVFFAPPPLVGATVLTGLCAWAAVFAWAGSGVYRRLNAALFGVAGAGAALLLVSGLALAGRLATDWSLAYLLGITLLACAGGWALPMLGVSTPWPANQKLRPFHGLFVGVAGFFLLSLYIAWGSYGQPLPPSTVVKAAQALAAQTGGGELVVSAPGPEAEELVAGSGLQALLASPERSRLEREVVMPALEVVVGGRQREIDTIYGGDTNLARQALQRYGASLVVLGPGERARYGEQAGAALEAMLASGELSVAYEDDSVRVLRAAADDSSPAWVLRPVSLTLPDDTSQSLAMPVDELPVINEYAWNGWANSREWPAVLLWLLLFELLGLLGLPIAARALSGWHDGGWAMSKLVGLLVWGFAVWLPVSLGWWVFNWWALLFGAIVLLAIGLALRGVPWPEGTAPMARGAVLRSELCFVLAFGVWAAIRALNPDLWHPYFGGEKPLEFGFLNAIIRSPVLPPYDPFYSDAPINYYYYGLFLLALPMRALGIDPAIGFNLALATIFALTAAAALALGRQLTGRWRYGLLAVFLLLLLGPPASAIASPNSESLGIGPVIEAARGGLSGFGERLGHWFWGPSRVIPWTINEFPLFGFVYGDLHPHLIALPFTLLAMGLAARLARRAAWPPSTLALSALTIGALAAANSWDAPTYAMLVGGALIGSALRVRVPRAQRGRAGWWRLNRVSTALLLALGVPALGIALYAPFFLNYRAQVGGVGLVRDTDSLQQYALLFGPFLLLLVGCYGIWIWAVARKVGTAPRLLVRAGAVGVPLLLAALLLTAAAPGAPVSRVEWPLRGVLALLAAIGLALAAVPASARRLRDGQWTALWLLTAGVLVALGLQFVVVRDHLAGGDYERMNTVFKFGEQIWALWAIGGAAAMALILRLLRRSDLLQGIWIGLFICSLLPGLVYPVAGIASRLSTKFDRTQPPTLNGLRFMQGGSYGVEDQSVDLGPDGEAIAWLKRNLAGTPIVLTSSQEYYRHYGPRVAANTGLPTVVDETHSTEQHPPDEVRQRIADVQELWSTADTDRATELLRKYHVDYVYLGPLERISYPAGLDKWSAMQGGVLESVYDAGGVNIMRVRRETLPDQPPMEQQAPAPQRDEVLEALEAQVAAEPANTAAAFGLAQRYLEQGRPEDAARVLETAAQAGPPDVPLLHLLGDVQASLGRDDEAVGAWRRAADLQPTASNVNKLGQGLTQLGRFDEAERVLQQAAAIDTSFPDVHYFLGELYHSRAGMGDRERAVAAYRRYLELAPPDGPWRAQAEQRLRE